MKRICSRLPLLAVALFATSGLAETAPIDLVVRNARLIDGTGADPVDDATILVSQGRVVDVLRGPSHHQAPRVIDARGYTVVPGLVDAHSHVLSELPDARTIVDLADSSPASVRGPEQVKDYIEHRLPTRLRRYLEAGVTTVVDLASYRPFIIDVRDRVNRGDLVGPRLFVVGPAFGAPGGHPAATMCHEIPWCVNNVSVSTNDPAVARRAVDELSTAGVDGIKVIFDAFDLGLPFRGYPKLRPDVLAAIVERAHYHGLPVVAHVMKGTDAATVAEAGVDAIVHIPMKALFSYESPSGEPIPELLSRLEVPVVSTIGADVSEVGLAIRALIGLGRLFIFAPTVRALREGGVTFVLGTDFNGLGEDPDPGEAVRGEAKALVAYGFSNREVLQIATGNAARFPIIPDDIGTIAAGSIADMLLLGEDPLEDVAALFAAAVVIKDGEIVIDKR